MMSTVPTVDFKNFLGGKVRCTISYMDSLGVQNHFHIIELYSNQRNVKSAPPGIFASSPLTRKSWLRHWHIHRKNVKQRTVRVRAGSTNKRDTMTNEFSPPAVLHQAYVTMSVACRNIEVCSRHVTLKGRCWPNFHNDKHHLSTGVS